MCCWCRFLLSSFHPESYAAALNPHSFPWRQQGMGGGWGGSGEGSISRQMGVLLIVRQPKHHHPSNGMRHAHTKIVSFPPQIPWEALTIPSQRGATLLGQTGQTAVFFCLVREPLAESARRGEHILLSSTQTDVGDRASIRPADRGDGRGEEPPSGCTRTARVCPGLTSTWTTSGSSTASGCTSKS